MRKNPILCWCMAPGVGRGRRLLLIEKGHEAHTLDLPALGEDQTPIKNVTLDSYVDAVKNLVSAIDEQVYLIGHSMGGLVITQTAERIPDKITALGYLAAFSPKNGESLFDYAMADTESFVTRHNQLNAEEGYFVVKTDKLPECFYGMCNQEDTNNAIARLRPQALAPLVKPVEISDEKYGSVRRCYIECTKDRALTWPMQQRL